MVDEGCIHGRFQPFHNEHLEYALEALDRCFFLWIGLSEPFPTPDGIEGPAERRAPSANPLNYRERQYMITRTLVSEGIAPERFGFIPFPIRNPDLLLDYLDPLATCFITINEDWDRQKRELIRQAGYEVDVLFERPKGIAASDLRHLLAIGNELWREFIPSSAASYLEEIDLPARMAELAGK